LLDILGLMSAPELRRLLTEHLTRQKLGLYWERDAIEHDKGRNANVVLCIGAAHQALLIKPLLAT
jgi:adenine-specific DNA-methyltransferase